jgi:hypothetical protein
MHLHYSPFQLSTPEQMAEPKKQVMKEKKHYMAACEERKRATHDLGATMPLSVAHEACSLPNAFISPNLPDVMRQAKAVFGEF